jgi:hypothetical protein
VTDSAIRNLACAIVLQAVKDYFKTTPQKQKVILKDLRSPYMDMLTNGTSVVVAEQLEKNPEEIAARIQQNHEIN